MAERGLIDEANRRIAAELQISWSALTTEQKEFGRKHTIVVLQAIFEPTQAMLNAAPVSPEIAKKVWQAMIGEALEDK